jgi:hypothetical protein
MKKRGQNIQPPLNGGPVTPPGAGEHKLQTAFRAPRSRENDKIYRLRYLTYTKQNLIFTRVWLLSNKIDFYSKNNYWKPAPRLKGRMLRDKYFLTVLKIKSGPTLQPRPRNLAARFY